MSSIHGLEMRSRHDSGVALLLVLALLTALIVPCLTMARMAVTRAVTRSMEQDLAVALDLERECERVIRDWLARDGRKVVLPWEQAVPGLELMDEAIPVADRWVRVKILAIDQCGLPPIERADASRYVGHVPQRVLEHARESFDPAREPCGLDWFVEPESGDSPFPKAVGENTSDAPLGSLVATHNPDSLVNANSAPAWLIEATLRELGRGGIEVIQDARQRGLPVATGQVPTRDSVGQSGPVLVTESTAWAFRVDVSIEPGVARSWWLVFTRGTGGWHSAQRIAIPF